MHKPNQSINQSKQNHIAPYAANESEAQNTVDQKRSSGVDTSYKFKFCLQAV